MKDIFEIKGLEFDEWAIARAQSAQNEVKENLGKTLSMNCIPCPDSAWV